MTSSNILYSSSVHYKCGTSIKQYVNGTGGDLYTKEKCVFIYGTGKGKSREGVLSLLGLHLPVQLVDELAEDERVDVLAQLVQQEPVAKLATPAKKVNKNQ